MAFKRLILEIGTGNDLHGGDYTKAAVRAVEDAVHHSSLTMVRSFGIDRDALKVNITVGVQKPELIDAEAVKSTLSFGAITVKAVKGGLDVVDEPAGDLAVIASAAVEVWADLP